MPNQVGYVVLGFLAVHPQEARQGERQGHLVMVLDGGHGI